jgi:hypothetical protein
MIDQLQIMNITSSIDCAWLLLIAVFLPFNGNLRNDHAAATYKFHAPNRTLQKINITPNIAKKNLKTNPF